MASQPDAAAGLPTVLADLLRENGPDLIDDRSRLLALLRERASSEPRGVHLLMTALDAGVPQRLREPGPPLTDLELGQETAQIVDHFGAGAEHAREAVETWARALDRLPPASAPRMTTLSVEALGSSAASPVAGSAPILPLPAPGARPMALPGVAATKPMVLPLPGATAGGGRPMPLPGTAAPLPSRRAPNRWVVILPVLALAVGGGLWAISDRTPGAPAAPGGGRDQPEGGRPQPKGHPVAGGATTDEGYAIADLTAFPTFSAPRIDGDPNSLLLPFGLRFGDQTYTYQLAIAFKGSEPTGAALIKVVKGGRESSTGQLEATRATQSNGYSGFTVSGRLQGTVAAPSICISALVGKSPDSLDLTKGGGHFCAFGTSATGLCDGDVKHGCGDLAP